MWKTEAANERPYRDIRFAHGRRHRQAIDMVLSLQPRVILNYGAGNGCVVAEVLKRDIPWLCRAIV